MEYSPYVTWFEKTASKRPAFESLSEDVFCDICIIGGAFTGVSAALYGAEKGQNVVLVEPSKIGFGCSGRGGGLIEGGLNTTLDDISDFLGRLSAHNFWKSTIDARDNIAQVIEKNNIECGYSKGLTKICLNAVDIVSSGDYATYYTNHFENEYIDFLDEDETHKIINMPSSKYGLRYANAGSFNPLSYLFGMARAAVKKGARIYEDTTVESISEGDEIIVKTKNGTVRCKNLIVCGNAYMSEEHSPEKTRTVSTDYFQIVTNPLSDELLDAVSPTREAVAGRGMLGTYIQFTDDNRIIYGGPQYTSIKNSEVFAKKQIKALEKLLPELKSNINADYLWHGPVGVPMSYLPIFAKVSKNHYVAHSFNGHGVSIPCYGGRVLVDALLGDDTLFDTYTRIKPIVMPEFAHHAIAKLTLLYYRFCSKPFNV
ncbi:MAG: gamma-glutamylputrescine oxidase [Alphaproteobacteria bacterium]|jgi:gamma-glutamylputrescine oxidase